ncbi:MAG: hypothetical protein RBR15_12530 [Sphaerochaeta sp.]|nr:hypothetical protein [Sphaerochaeta sp.]
MDFSIVLTIPMIVMFGILVTNLFHDLVLDWYREYLFSLRSDLFDKVSELDSSMFNAAAYRIVEAKINSAIHFAEVIKPSLIFIITNYRKELRGQILEYQKDSENEFKRDLKKTGSGEHSKIFLEVDTKLEQSLGMYIIFSSWTMIFLFLGLMLVMGVEFCVSWLVSLISKTASVQSDMRREGVERKWRNGLRLIEASAGSYISHI